MSVLGEAVRRYFTAVAFSSEVGETPLARRVLGDDLVLARLDGRVVALPDRCAHRGAPLSMGDVRTAPEGEMCLVCPYHGLHLDVGGRAVRYPARPDDRLSGRLDLSPCPSVEAHGLVWVALDPEPIGGVPDWSAYADPDLARFELGPHPWAAMAPRIVENFNDMAHFATVHAATFGDADRPVVPPLVIEPTDDGLFHETRMVQLDRVTLDGPLVPIEVTFTYAHTFPFATELKITYDADRVEWIQMVATPVDDGAALVFQQNLRNFDLDGDIAAWHDFQMAVNEEDRHVLEAARPAVIRPDGKGAGEIALGTDDFTVAYRRLWAGQLA